jgi:hypothetical protein
MVCSKLPAGNDWFIQPGQRNVPAIDFHDSHAIPRLNRSNRPRAGEQFSMRCEPLLGEGSEQQAFRGALQPVLDSR